MVRHMVGVIGSCERHGFFEEYMSCTLFIYTLRGNPMHWCAMLPKKAIHLACSSGRRDRPCFQSLRLSITQQRNYEITKKHPMNPLKSVTHTFVILHTHSPKMKLIGNFSMGDLSIFFKYPKIRNS